MRKVCFIAFLLCSFAALQAQLNIQAHYDFGRSLYSDQEEAGRPLITTTVEYFRPDNYGSTFFFVDMDYTKKGIALAYWEVSRDLKFWNAPITAHVEYNGGLSNIASLSNCFLVGPSYGWNSKDYSRGFTLAAMYKYIGHSTFFDGSRNNFQLTSTWYVNFLKGKLTFNGFVDFWKEESEFGNYIFMTEPQFWVNLGAFDAINDKCKLSVGGEVELTNNFGGRDGFYAIPTVGMKWTF